MGKCFIIMPITTPEEYVEVYDGDIDHFTHTLKSIFVPAVTKAGFDPILPIAKGAEVIQAEIIQNLESADLVLCDISTLNPNVFFELGCRTALNKPVAYVVDEHVGKIPFDTGIINHYKYLSTLRAWESEEQIQNLSEHLKESYDGSKGGNTLWKYFGLKTLAKSAPAGDGSQDALALLSMQMEAIKRAIDQLKENSEPFRPSWSNAELQLPIEGIPLSDIDGKFKFKLNKSFQHSFDLLRKTHKEIINDAMADFKKITRVVEDNAPPNYIQTVKHLIEDHIRELATIVMESNDEIETKSASTLLNAYRKLLQ